MRKIIVLWQVGLVLSLVIMSSLAVAEDCDTTMVKSVLRHALFDYFQHPSSSTLPPAKIRDLLKFYLSLAHGQITVDCTVHGQETGIPMEWILTDATAISEPLPHCSDDTMYGECSASKPRYCYAGTLLSRCGFCGCPAGTACGFDGGCTSKVTHLSSQPEGGACSHSYECSKGLVCENQICQKVNSCSDSDGGAVLSVKGGVSITYSRSGLQTKGDYCANATTLTEIVCGKQGEQWEEITVLCPSNICESGACTNARCGDHRCTGKETCGSCATDCGRCPDGSSKDIGELTQMNGSVNVSMRR